MNNFQRMDKPSGSGAVASRLLEPGEGEPIIAGMI
jgi:hypothetical protein